MSEMNLIKPPKIGVAAEASAGHRMIGPAKTDGAKAAPEPKTPLVSGQRRAGQFGAAPGIQINRRGEAPVTKLAPQTIQVLRSTLSSVAKFCRQEKATQASNVVAQMTALINAIAAGESIADPVQPTQQAPKAAAPPQAPAQAPQAPAQTSPSSTPASPGSASPTVGSPGDASKK